MDKWYIPEIKELYLDKFKVKVVFLYTVGLVLLEKPASVFYDGTSGCILFFDLNNFNSFLDMKTWYNQLTHHIKVKIETIQIGIGEENIKDVNAEEVKIFTSQKDIPYYEISSVWNWKYLEKIILKMIEEIMNNRKNG